MAIRSYKPTSPGRRFVTTSDFKELTTSQPEKKLTKGKKRSSGRNSEGHITSRHRGRGHKRRYRLIDFRRNKFDVPARVVRNPAHVVAAPVQHPDAAETLIDGSGGEGKRYARWKPASASKPKLRLTAGPWSTRV